MGGETVASAGGARIAFAGDTLRFDAFSPFFRTRSGVQHLAFPVLRDAGIIHLPEQFFIEWLPAHHPDDVEYRGGVLRSRRGAAVVAGGVAPEDETRVVILDAGHGGRDPGHMAHGLREKDVALQIARATAAVLGERGYEVHLTRSTDTLIALADRPRIANEKRRGRPAVFLSIHTNAFTQSSVRGFETFFLSEARTEDERRVAEMENAAVAFEEGPAAGSELDQILSGLRNDFWVRASNDLAEVVQEGQSKSNDGPDRGVKRAGFHVLVGVLMPAVLVEVAFLSNATDATLLASERFRSSVATGIADAVDGFFDSHRYMSSGGR
jgi:N-acetylmuramoyl-L-alanine amidase